jgi:hypothetical protein
VRLPLEYVLDAIEDLEPIRRDNWRHGTKDTKDAYVVEYEGKHYRVVLAVHHDEGVQMPGDYVDGVEVVAVEKTVIVWEPKA